ncbi:MAG: cation transporter [Candidatus Heimdallarchaeaceae archaeon]
MSKMKEEIVICIPDIHCSKCASNIATVLKYLEGIESSKILFESKMAKVVLDTAIINRRKIVDSLVHLGFKAYLSAVM